MQLDVHALAVSWQNRGRDAGSPAPPRVYEPLSYSQCDPCRENKHARESTVYIPLCPDKLACKMSESKLEKRVEMS